MAIKPDYDFEKMIANATIDKTDKLDTIVQLKKELNKLEKAYRKEPIKNLRIDSKTDFLYDMNKSCKKSKSILFDLVGIKRLRKTKYGFAVASIIILTHASWSVYNYLDQQSFEEETRKNLQILIDNQKNIKE